MTESQFLLERVQEAYGVSERLLRSPERTKEACIARFTWWWLLRTMLGWSYPRIGALVGRDHTTVMHGVREFEKRGGPDQFNAGELRRAMDAMLVERERLPGDPIPVDSRGITSPSEGTTTA